MQNVVKARTAEMLALFAKSVPPRALVMRSHQLALVPKRPQKSLRSAVEAHLNARRELNARRIVVPVMSVSVASLAIDEHVPACLSDCSSFTRQKQREISHIVPI